MLLVVALILDVVIIYEMSSDWVIIIAVCFNDGDKQVKGYFDGVFLSYLRLVLRKYAYMTFVLFFDCWTLIFFSIKHPFIGGLQLLVP